MKVKGKTAVVTGASSGIGRGTAVALAKHGCNVALVARNKEELENTKKQCEAYGVKATVHVTDLTDRAQIDSLPERVLAEHEAVDLLYNIAGICASGKLFEVSDEAFDRVMNLDFMAVAYCMRRFLPHLMTRPEAHIVNCASIQAMLSFVGDAAYSASKAAVRALSDAARFELEDDTNVMVSYVIMGGVNSNLVLNSIPLDNPNVSDEEKARRRANALAFADNLLGMEPIEAGEAIVAGTEKGKARIVAGNNARNALILAALVPVNYWKILNKVVKR